MAPQRKAPRVCQCQGRGLHASFTALWAEQRPRPSPREPFKPTLWGAVRTSQAHHPGQLSAGNLGILKAHVSRVNLALGRPCTLLQVFPGKGKGSTIHRHTWAHIHIHKHRHTHIHVNMDTQGYAHAYKHRHAHTWMHTHGHTWTQAQTRTHAHIWTHAHERTHKYRHTHAHVHT